MKKVLLSLVAMMFATMSFAQNTVVASLSHGSDISLFYGSNALIDAMEQAESGDIINLSAGTFYATDINKAITLRGAGVSSAEPTYITTKYNDMVIEIPKEETGKFTMEGIILRNRIYIRGTFPDYYFVKSNLTSVVCNGDTDEITNMMFTNCRITNEFIIGGSNTAYFVNSYVAFITKKTEKSGIYGFNCVICQGGLGELHFTKWENCIFFSHRYAESSFPASTQISNCALSEEYDWGYQYYDPFRNLSSHPNCTRFLFAQMFKEDFNPKEKETQSYELNDAAKTTFLGTDGKQIGLYGGLIPYDTTPSYPLISTMTVNDQTDSDGKLKVTIEVNK